MDLNKFGLSFLASDPVEQSPQPGSNTSSATPLHGQPTHLHPHSRLFLPYFVSVFFIEVKNVFSCRHIYLID